MKNPKHYKDNILKRWWKLTQPSKGALAGQIIFYSGFTIMLSVITLFAARTINHLYNHNWTMAYVYLALELATIILRNVFMHIQYLFYCKQITTIRHNVSQKVYNKILSVGDTEQNKFSKEKIINIATNNLGNLSEFPDSIANFIAYLLQVLFTLIVVFTSNALAGGIVLALGILNFFVYTAFNRKLGRLLLERYEKKDDMFKSYSKIIDGKSVINALSGKQTYENELLGNVDSFSKSYNKYWMTYSWKNDIWFATWHIIVYAITALMIFYVSRGTMDIAIYLIIVPYLTSCTDKLCTLFDKSSNLENMRVDVDRINTILELDDKELIKYGEFNLKSDGYNLAFINVTENAKPNQKYTLANANMQFERGEINVVKGPKECGKRVIFDLIRRHEYPDRGKILLDNLNLYDYNEKTFKTHISYASSYPVFIKGSIKENLMLACDDFIAIQKACDELGVLDAINNLPQGFDTNIIELDSSAVQFMLGFVRALLTNCKILMIYELPQDAPKEFRQKIKQLLTNYKIDKTIIVFTHSNDFDDISKCMFEVSEGKVKKVK